jgi:hypothetical protein
MKKRILKWILKICVNELYSKKEQREEFKRQVNNETWIGSQIGSGGCSLSISKPICDEEVISIMCTLRDERTYQGYDSKTKPIDYYSSSWTN